MTGGRGRGEAAGRGDRRPEPERGFARQLEIERDAEPHRDGQPEHPAAAFGIELLHDPGAYSRHLPSFDRLPTLPYLPRAFSLNCGRS